MNHRARGIRLEYVVIDRLCELGYTCIRSAGSHGAVDVVAIKPGVVILCQAKIRKESIGSREWQELWVLAEKANAIPLLAYRPSMRKLAFARLLGPRRLHEKMAHLLSEFHP